MGGRGEPADGRQNALEVGLLPYRSHLLRHGCSGARLSSRQPDPSKPRLGAPQVAGWVAAAITPIRTALSPKGGTAVPPPVEGVAAG